MSIKSEQTKIKIKNKVLDIWHGFWRMIGKALSRPCNYIYEKRMKRLSDPLNYNHLKLLKIMEKRIASDLLTFGSIHLLDTEDTFKSDNNDLDLPYDYMRYSKNRYMENYRQYAYYKDKYLNWAEFIVENLDVDYEVRKATEFFNPYDYEYKKYRAKNVYIIKIRNKEKVNVQ